jgi:hypothetical protein
MNAVTHTQGPWAIEKNSEPLMPEKCVSIGGHGLAWSSFCLVAVQMKYSDKNEPKGLANAALIAEAPAMKLALDLIAAGVAEIRDGMFICDGFHIRPDEFGGWNFVMERFGWDRARAALAGKGAG